MSSSGVRIWRTRPTGPGLGLSWTWSSGSICCSRSYTKAVYATRDGRHLAVSAMEPKFWEMLCTAIDRPDLKPYAFATGAEGQRIRHELEAAFAKRSFAEWTALFERVDCCVTPVLRFEESLQNEQLQARGMIVEVAGVKQFAPPFKISELPFEARLPPPEAGEHSEEILHESGFSADEIADLRAQKVI